MFPFFEETGLVCLINYYSQKEFLWSIPKKLDAKEIGDFRLISLVHSVPKIFAKALANRLRPRLVDFVCANQSAFIRGHNLHDNFLLVRRVAKRLHNWKIIGNLLKLDISCAFDLLSCVFLFDVLQQKGLGTI